VRIESSLKTARDAAVRGEEAKSRFLAVMSHEMRTPLNGLIAALDIVQKTTRLSRKQAEFLDLARQCGNTSLVQIDDVLELTRLEREGVIVGYTVRLAALEGESGVEAYVGITTEPKAGALVTHRLAALPELRQLCSVSGESDYLALLRTESTARLDQLLDEIGAIEGVIKTNTSVVLARRIDRT
jgi:DNA-binding Lrp family transcriptional regulator